MNRDNRFMWLAAHRVPPKGCSRCGLTQIAYYRDADEQPVGQCCVGLAAYRATVDAAGRRVRSLGHDCPAEGCQACADA